jgi:predicted Zn-ribbon and HTH transcriptional regulator
MKKEVKKVGEMWITPETLDNHIPKNCIVDCKVIDMKLNNSFPLLLRPVINSKVKYEIFAKSRKAYEDWKHSERKNKKKEPNMLVEKKIRCKHCGSIVTAVAGMCVSCSCGKCTICETGSVREAILHKDYEDLSRQLLSEMSL